MYICSTHAGALKTSDSIEAEKAHIYRKIMYTHDHKHTHAHTHTLTRTCLMSKGRLSGAERLLPCILNIISMTHAFSSSCLSEDFTVRKDHKALTFENGRKMVGVKSKILGVPVQVNVYPEFQ
jgi:hypothetical protein